MYNGKYAKRSGKIRRGRKRTGTVVLSLLLLLLFTIGGTVAYLSLSTAPVTNTFTSAQVDNEIVETFDGTVKKDVKVKNTGDTDAYIRAQVLIYWGKKDGDNVIAFGGSKPALVTDYTIKWKQDGWVKHGDDYYWKTPVAPDASTGILFTDCQLTADADIPEGYTLIVEVLGQSIQARPESAVKDAWGIAVNADGTLKLS